MAKSNFSKFLNGGSGLATFSKDQIRDEILQRERNNNPFPLHVFNEKIKPFLDALNKMYDLPPSYIGLGMLSAYSTAIGTAYRLDTGNSDYIFLPVWGCICGISSSGGTTVINKVFEPLDEIQREFDAAWIEKTFGLSLDKINLQRIDTVVARDSHLATLVKSVLPDNPKGIIKVHDELLEWTNGMNQLSKKEGTDEQFWNSAWSCANYSGIRSGKQKFVVERPFVNVIGKAQYSILARFFAKDRDTTGFIFRLLFAMPDVDKISQRETDFIMPKEWTELHARTLRKLYKDLPVDNADKDFKICRLNQAAKKLFDIWQVEKVTAINAMTSINDKNIQSGIFGKIKEYALRFAAILHVSDKCFDADLGGDFCVMFKGEETISGETMSKAIELADYFLQSAKEVYELVQNSTFAPPHVLQTAYLFKKKVPYSEIGEMLYGEKCDKNKVRARRQVMIWIKEYPRVFGSLAR